MHFPEWIDPESLRFAYQVACPYCGVEFNTMPSLWMQEHGLNRGQGSCPCSPSLIFLLRLDETGRMQAVPYGRKEALVKP